jgi:peptide/nickel transport system ATP-binding protein
VGYVKAVDDVSLTILEGQTLGLVGESGSGKTTLAHSVMRGIDPTAGAVIFHDQARGAVDVASADGETLRHVRRNMQMVFQDPFSSLNPRMTVLDIIAEPLEVNGIARGKAAQERVAELLQLVGLRPEYMRRYPHAFSGGQRQRIVVARALALNPRLVLMDEPTSALDVSIQAQTLNLLKDLQERLRLSYLFISHDLGVVEHVSDVVAVMYVGRVVEVAPTQKLYGKPKHPYTEALLSSIPKPDPTRKRRRIAITGEIPNPANPPSGCHFHPRCPYAKPVCSQEVPPLRQVTPGQFAACHFSEELALKGVNDF